jgi:hypothetical protein
MAPAAPRCRNCTACRALNRRGLCRACYDRPAVRRLYPRDARNAPRKVARDRRVLLEPTDAEAETQAKILVLRERAAARRPRQHLFHPDDPWYDKRNVPTPE